MDSIIELARALGPYAICGEGNVSVKDDDSFWVKASGTSLDTLEKRDLVACKLSGVPFDSLGLKPSIETGFHAWFMREFDEIKFIAHTHPPKSMQVVCSEQIWSFADHRLFPDQVVRNGAKSCVVPYAMPGKPLLEEIKKSVLAFIEEEGYFPKLILLQNHGIIVASTSHKECIASTMMCEKSAEIFIGAKVLGQTRFLSEDEVNDIDKCPSEKHRRKLYQ
jgi:ribulose-5-phosphate 4-epimerase/fuculose-1-phosphate aldolase|tara:strand:+ start:14262 stop:14924 length:663 start_codon:yes stop_codon:yes gene_type:complete